MIQKIKSIKGTVNTFLTRFVGYCNLGIVTINSKRIRSQWLRNALLENVRFFGDLALWISQYPKVDAYRLWRPDGWYYFIGLQKSAEFFTDLLFPGDSDRLEFLSRVSIRSISSSEFWENKGAQMVVCETSKFSRIRSSFNYQVTIPAVIDHTVEIPEPGKPVETLIAGHKGRHFRNIINKFSASGVHFTISYADKDFDHFYHQMLVPYIQIRHRQYGYLEPYDQLYREFKKDGLLLVLRGNERIAGCLLEISGKFGTGKDAGVLNGSAELLKEGIFTFIVWSTIKHFYDLGVRTLSLGSTLSMGSDPVFRYKAYWRPKAQYAYGSIKNNITFLFQELTPEIEAMINPKELIREHKGDYYLVIFLPPGYKSNEEDFQKEIIHAQDYGLAGVCLVSPQQDIYLK